MNIKLLGTGSIYSKYNCASELVDNKILIDAGQGILKQILKIGYNLKDLKMIIITHLHSDHYSDLPGLILNLQTIQDEELRKRKTNNILIKEDGFEIEI